VPPEAAFDLSFEHHAGWLVARASGDLDLAAVPRIAAEFEDRSDPHVAVDLSGIRFIDSAGLEALERLRTRRRMVMVAPSGVVRRLLTLTELTDDYEIVDHLDGLEQMS
jgi:anti-anti-sigma factor